MSGQEHKKISAEMMLEADIKLSEGMLASSKSNSGLYRVLSMNSHLSGVPLARDMCVNVLEKMDAWYKIPERIRNQILDDVLNFMTDGCLPSQEEVEKYIASHPLVELYRGGSLPPQTEHQRQTEEAERKRRESDIRKLRKRTANELSFVQENAGRYAQFAGAEDDVPTSPGRKPATVKWDKKGSTYSSS